jgi:adhesin transport system outer membrane protein
MGAAVAFAFTAHAQTGTPKSNLPDPMVQAVRKAVATSPDVQAKWNAFQAADSQRAIAKAGYFPQIDLSASVGNENRTSGGVSLGSYDLSSAQLSLNQILFDGFFTATKSSD